MAEKRKTIREMAKESGISVGLIHQAIVMGRKYPHRVDDIIAGTHTWADVRREEGDEPSKEEKRLIRVLGSIKMMDKDDLLIVLDATLNLYEAFNTEQKEKNNRKGG